MTISVPFANRPATPWVLNFRPTPLGAIDVSQITGDISNVFRTIQQGQPGMYTVQQADGSLVTYRQPQGTNINLPVGSVSGQLGTAVTGTLSTGTGVWLLLAVGAAFLLFSGRGKR